MKKFMVIYHAPAAAMEQMKDMSPEDMKKGMEPWTAWMEKCGSSLIDGGSPLAGGLKLTTGGSAPSDKEVAGYSILEAEDMQAAKAMLAGHPHLEWTPECSIEVHESFPMEM